MIEEIFGQPIGIYDLDVPDELNQEMVDFAYHCQTLSDQYVPEGASPNNTKYANNTNSYIGAHTRLFNRCHLFYSFPKDILIIINDAVSEYFKKSNYFEEMYYPQFAPFLDRTWSCIMKSNDKIDMHNHMTSKISLAYYPHKEENSGNFCLSNIGINTHYKDIKISEHTHLIETMKSRLIIFPSFIFHFTETNKSNKDRISYSLDYNVIGLAHSIPPLPLVEKLQHDTAQELCSIGEI